MSKLRKKVHIMRLGGQIKFFAIAAAVAVALFLVYRMIQTFELKFGFGGGSGIGIGTESGIGIGTPKTVDGEGVIKVTVKGNTYEVGGNNGKFDIDELSDYLDAEKSLKGVNISDDGATLNGYNRLINLLEKKNIKYTEEDERDERN